MGAYTGSPTVNSGYEYGDRNGKLQGVIRDLTLSISSQGGATNSIGYAALGFASGGITSAQLVNFTDGSSQNRALLVWTDTNLVLLGDPQTSTDADRGEPTDVTGTLRILVRGRPA